MAHTHAIDGPLGCPTCAGKRSAIWRDLTEDQKKDVIKKSHEAAKAYAKPSTSTEEEHRLAKAFLGKVNGR